MKMAAFVAALTLAASSASAATLSQVDPGDVFDGGGHAAVSGITNRPGTFSAGAFHLKDQDGNSFFAWCLDVLNNLSLPGTYNITADPFSNRTADSGDLTADRIANITSLFTLNYGTSGLLTDNDKSAGFQMALWELVYETDSSPFSVSTGNWRATSSLGSAVTWANDFLATLLTPPSQQDYNLTFYQAANGQNLVTAAPVPIPAALALFATALGGLGFFRWMGRRPATA